MEFNEFKNALKNLTFDTQREDRDDYFEAVIIKEELPRLTGVLNQFFGEAVWQSKGKLTPLMEEAIKDFGGVMPGQTLYFCNEGSVKFFAMLWPWQDNEHITLKTGKK